MCALIGHPVEHLVRVRIGPIADRRLPPAGWRDLTRAELRALRAACGLEDS
jgi:16S rRNA U516 pseudouridylate synthase RsuA-like enzyme